MKSILLSLCLLASGIAHAGTVSAVVQFLAIDSDSSEAAVGVAYVIFNDAVPATRAYSLYEIPGLTFANRGTWKDTMVAAVIAHAATQGFTLTADNINWTPFEPGDYKLPVLAAAWTKDVTKTNIPTTATNLYTGLAGEGQAAFAQRMKQYRLVWTANKAGTGNLTCRLTEVATATNFVESIYAGAAGEFVVDTGWMDKPAWMSGETLLKPMGYSTVATDDPVFRQVLLYLR